MSDNQRFVAEQNSLRPGPPPPPTDGIGRDMGFASPAMTVTIGAARGEAATMGPPPPPPTCI